MNHLESSNIIMGSKLALAISSVAGSPVRLPLASGPKGKQMEFEKLEKRCESLKIFGQKLLQEMEKENHRITSDATCMRSSADREETRRIGRAMNKIIDQQTTLHSKMERLLDALMLQIHSGM